MSKGNIIHFGNFAILNNVLGVPMSRGNRVFWQFRHFAQFGFGSTYVEGERKSKAKNYPLISSFGRTYVEGKQSEKSSPQNEDLSFGCTYVEGELTNNVNIHIICKFRAYLCRGGTVEKYSATHNEVSFERTYVEGEQSIKVIFI